MSPEERTKNIGEIIRWRCPASEGYLGLLESSKFCPKCGARLTGETPEEAQTGER